MDTGAHTDPYHGQDHDPEIVGEDIDLEHDPDRVVDLRDGIQDHDEIDPGPDQNQGREHGLEVLDPQGRQDKKKMKVQNVVDPGQLARRSLSHRKAIQPLLKIKLIIRKRIWRMIFMKITVQTEFQ